MRRLLRLISILFLITVTVMGVFRYMAYDRETFLIEDLISADSRMVETVHGRFHALEFGPQTGAPIVFVHGSIGWSGTWKETLVALADQGYRAIAVDLPPMGFSDRGTRADYSRQAQALRLIGFVEALDIKPIVVAHSFGAGAAFEALMISPDAFQGAVIVSGTIDLSGERGMRFPGLFRSPLIGEALVATTITNPFITNLLLRRFVHQTEQINSAVTDTMNYPFLRSGTTESIAAWLPTVFDPARGASSSRPANYAEISLPVSLIWGREDGVSPPLQARALARALGGAPINWLDAVGHIPHIEAPTQFQDSLLDALAQILES